MGFRHLAPPQILAKVRGGCWCHSFDLRCPPLPSASLLIQVTCVHINAPPWADDPVLEQWCGPRVPVCLMDPMGPVCPMCSVCPRGLYGPITQPPPRRADSRQGHGEIRTC